jgi:uncharacterized protein
LASVSSLLHPKGARARPVEVLGDADLGALNRLLDADPHGNVVLAARLEQTGAIAPTQLGGAVLAIRDTRDRLAAAIFNGGSLLPLGGSAVDLKVLGDAVVRRRRVCSSIVGREDAVRALWDVLSAQWGPARLIRAHQPLLATNSVPQVPTAGFPPVRAMTDADLDAYMIAAVAMFREELDLPPLRPPIVDEYRRRVAGLIRARRAFGVVDKQGDVVFKADIGSVSRRTCQLQGVWTRPDLRGRGLATAALAEVLACGLELAPSVSLYVNDFNEPALRLYERLGMDRIGTFTTILF